MSNIYFNKQMPRYVVGIVVLTYGVYYLSGKTNEMNQLKNLTFFQISAASTAVLAYLFITGIKYQVLLSTYKIELSFKEWFGLAQIIKFFNMLFLKSGTVAAAYYLKSQHQLSYFRFIVAMAVHKLISLFTVVLLSLLISLIYFIYFGLHFYVVIFFSFLLATLIGLFYFPYYEKKEMNSFLFKKIREAYDFWNEYKKDTPVVIKVILLDVAAIPALGLRYYVAFKILDSPVSILECIIFSLVVSISGVVSIIPGNIGIREALVGFSTYYMDYGFDYGVLATALDRIIATIWISLLGTIYFHTLHLKGYSKKEQVRL